MDKTSLLNDLQFIFSIIGLPSAIYFIIIMIKGRRNISWRQIKKGTKYLAQKVEIINPDIIITFSGKGSIMANLVLSKLNNSYPLYTCILRESVQNRNFLIPEGWLEFNTPKWVGYIPAIITKFKDKEILVIDDITRSGKTIEKLTEVLVSHVVSSQKIHSMSLIADVHVLRDMEIPQFFWKQLKTDEYSLPWNKTRNNK